MRAARRIRRAEEDDESAFVSMTDLMVSFLFIIMILLAFFATQIAPRDAVSRQRFETVADKLTDREQKLRALEEENRRLRRQLSAQDGNPIERYNFRSAELRGKMLDRIQKRIKAADTSIDVSISRNGDALEFKGDGLFESGSYAPSPLGRRKMEIIAGILREELRCFALGERSSLASACNPAVALIDALQVEGHTDSTGTDVLNMDLSSSRGSAIYAIMVSTSPELLGFRNLRNQPIVSVAGYGKGRPIRDNNTVSGRDANRRIDLRFIMFAPPEEQFVPQRIEDLPRLRQLLAAGPVP
ncbi:OmpA/MotB family protein [Aquabacter spiritensis]|uniref:Flagellar motor protein MotB n=1 Tax=Aquabacter spiritensis TaxID=933073 RepID=A0A4R3LSW4_9HYPH|nr:OmpA family protein [Aquabacter spiritensis]TCT02629.1 flagellar motor protein MotB [Aquabacter spiritensis]